jgi:SPP1 gp7 family putative phage head morphogenesis protein
VASIYEVAKDHSRRIRNLDKQTATRVFAHYALAFENIREEYERILRMAANAAERGEVISQSWLRRQAMLEQAMARIGNRLNQLSTSVAAEIASAQRAAIDLGSAQAIDTMSAGQRASTGRLSVQASFSRAPVEAMEQMIGFVGDGSPLRTVLSRYGEQSRAAISRALVTGIVEGKNPRAIAREIRAEVDGNRAKALTISRTEVLRAHRTAAIENYRENKDVLEGWRWVANLDARTCVVCWAMHGTVHPLSDEFGTHPNCRCSPLPVVRGARIEIESGVVRFEKLSEDDKREILGKGAYERYKAGAIQITDLVEREESAAWGTIRRRRTLAEIDQVAMAAAYKMSATGGGGPPSVPGAQGGGQPISPPGAQLVSSAITWHKKSPIGRPLQDVLNEIDAIHTDGALPDVRAKGFAGNNPQGSYQPVVFGGPQMRISTRAVRPELTCVHEIGHLLDCDSGVPMISRAALDPDLKDWRNAITQSIAYKRLSAAKSKPYRIAPGGGIVDISAALDYWLQPWELWARSYAQFIASRSSNIALRAQLADAIASPPIPGLPVQWDPTDFVLIDKAIERLFRKKGWM